MRKILDWHIQITWWFSGIFATGALWYFLSTNNWLYATISLLVALILAAIAVFLHKQKDVQQAKEEALREELDQKTLAKNPTKNNIERVIIDSDPKKDWIKLSDNEKDAFSYVNDVNLRFEMIFDASGIQCEDFREPWANQFPDQRATGYWCNLFYGSSQINRYILVAVDGARALLPVPKFNPINSSRLEVRSIDYKVAQIYDTIDTLEQYMASAGLYVASDAT